MTARPVPADAACVALFDLDYTLLDGDCEARWSQFLYERGLVGAEFVAQIDAYYHDYEQGQLDIHAYEEFLLRPLTQHPLATLYRLRADYLEIIRRLVRPALQARVASIAACGCSRACTVHGHRHAATAGSAPVRDADRTGFWGALGCSCWAA